MARRPRSKEDSSVRLLKVGERVRHVLSELLIRQQVRDDTLTAHTVSITFGSDWAATSGRSGSRTTEKEPVTRFLSAGVKCIRIT